MADHPEITSEKCIRLQSHILNAHQIWNCRIDHTKDPFEVWQIHPILNWKNIDRDNYENSLRIIESFDLNYLIRYTNSRGQSFTNNIRDIFFHAINHSTYHRGQIATEFKHIGIDPLLTDYILYKRS